MRSALAVGHAFGCLGLHRIHATVDIDNRASSRALENNGFHRVGIIRGFAMVGGRWRDHHLYQLSAEDWLAFPAPLIAARGDPAFRSRLRTWRSGTWSGGHRAWRGRLAALIELALRGGGQVGRSTTASSCAASSSGRVIGARQTKPSQT